MAGVQAVQSALVLYITFVAYRLDTDGTKGPGCYNRCMPVGHYVLTVILFLATPVVIVVAYVAALARGADTGAMFPYLTFCTLLTTLLSLWFFASLLDVFEKLKQEHIATCQG